MLEFFSSMTERSLTLSAAAACASVMVLTGIFASHALSFRPSKNRKLRYSVRTRSESVQDAVQRLRDQVAKKRTGKLLTDETTEVWSAYWREQQLYGISDMLEENMDELYQALKDDIGRTYGEFVLETHVTLMEIRSIVRNLRTWMQPEKVNTPIWLRPASSFIQYEPYGVALIIGTWNFPLSTTIMPLCAALCAGNACIVKPSESSPSQSDFFAKYIPKYVDPEAVTVILGAGEISKECVDSDIDFCFFTGGAKTGGIVASSCASRHIPFITELGGKCPCIIDTTSCDLTVMARRLIQVKTMNAGQLCLSVDHAIVIGDESSARRVIDSYLVPEIKRQMGENAQEMMAHIINTNMFKRVSQLLQGAEKFIVYGGQMEEDKLWIEPTLLLVDPAEAEELAIFKEEIFGPLLPIVYVRSIDQAIEFISKRANPLSVYMFSRNSKNVSQLLSKVPTGSVCINDIAFQASNPNLPFGVSFHTTLFSKTNQRIQGVRESGSGRYHGKYGFTSCSNAKAVMIRSDRIDFTLRYNPKLQEPWVQRLFIAVLGWM